MSGIPLPSTTPSAQPGKAQGLYQVAKSRRGVALLLTFTLASFFYIFDAGPLINSRVSSYRTQVVPTSTVPTSTVPTSAVPTSTWPKLGGTDVNSGTEELSATPLTALGLEADRSFHLGSTSKSVYKAELEQFVARAFPEWLRNQAQASIDLYLGDSTKVLTLPEVPHKIYQTAKVEPTWGWRTSTWKDLPDYTHFFFDDERADKWVRAVFGGSEIETVWDAFGPGIKRSDLLRYLLVMVEGGIYSDMDTLRLRDISKWGQGADVRGPPSPGLPSAFVGIEADVGTRSDWHKWWPRPLQIVQWTFGAAPLHPILIDTVRRVHRTTAMVEANKANATSNDTGANTGKHWVGGELLRDDGSVSIMEWTGPGVFTDSVIRYLAAEHDVTWPALKNLRKPVRIRDAVILPVTGFSPGVGMFGAGETSDKEAMVQHMFAGSWKTGKHDE